MEYGLYISAEGATAQSSRLESLSNNLANVNTSGFKRDLAIFQARYAEAVNRGLDYPGSHSLDDLGGGVMLRGTVTDFSSGPLRKTGIDTDLAIRGDAFFQVRRADRTLLTRSGNFLVSPNGQLTTTEGYPLLDEDGAVTSIDPDGGPWKVTQDGVVVQGTNQTRLALVRPAANADLTKVGENLFASRTLATPIPVEERSVMPGFLEQSGVNPTQEMVELIETSRAFEANVNMVRNQDQMLESLISGVLKA